MSTVLITGAGNEIGSALALSYVGTNTSLLLVDKNLDKLTAVAQKCRDLGAKAVEVASMNAGDARSMEYWIDKMDDRYVIDIAVICASTLTSCDDNNKLDIVNTNVFGAINTIQFCASRMQQRGRGNIVIISSTTSMMAMPDLLGVAMNLYCASTRFLKIYGESIRCLYAPVRVHVICLNSISADYSELNSKLSIFSTVNNASVVRAVKSAIIFNSPLLTVPLRSWFALKLLLPLIPFFIYELLAVLFFKRRLDDDMSSYDFPHKVSVNRNPRNILITGASSGIGRALAQEYAANGNVLMLFGMDEERLQQTAELCANKKARTSTFSIDVRDKRRMERYIQECDDNDPIDLLIANAGVSGGVGKHDIEDYDQIDKIVRTNLLGTTNTIEPILERMKKRKKGQIVIIASILGLRGIPGQPSYCASKAAVISYGEGLRMELAAFNIGVTIICPGYVKTNMSVGNATTFTSISPEYCARRIKNHAAKNSAIAYIPLYVGLLVNLVIILLPTRVLDWIASKFYPRKPKLAS